MSNKKLLAIFLILLIIILAVFAVFYFARQSKVLKNQAVQPKEEIVEQGQIFPLKQVILSTDKQIYGPDEEIKATVIIRNPFPEAKKWTMAYYFMSEDERFSDIGQTKKIALKPGQTEKAEFSSDASRNLPPGNYKIKLEVLEQEQVISAKSQIIQIQGTNKELTAMLQVCQDAKCQKEKVVFLLGEKVYLAIKSDISNLTVKGKIKYSNKEDWQDLDFKDKASAFNAEQAGSYQVVVNLEKDGYQSLSLQKDFAVSAQSSQIINASKCNADGKCGGEENKQNCPQDCL